MLCILLLLLLLSHLNKNYIFSTDFRKKRNIYILNFRKILPVEDELFHVTDRQSDRQTDVTKLIVFFFCNFLSASEKRCKNFEKCTTLETSAK